MKAQMLKIAGVKSEKEFYKKFPDEASFMKAHGKEFKKAMRANKVDKAQVGRQLPSAREMNTQLKQMYPFPTTPDINKMMKPVTVPESATTEKVGAEATTDFSPYIQAGQDVLRGVSMIKEQKKRVKQAQQDAQLTGVQATAAASKPLQPIKNQYVTPWDKVVQPNQLFPSQGVGTNVLAEDGAVINQIGGNPTEIQNTFAPNVIYSDMGYEPLSDSSRVKQYQQGGQLYGMLNDSKFGDIMNQGGGQALSQLSSAITGEEDAGTAIGGGIGQAAGQFFLGPVGGMVGKAAGKLIGDLIDQSDRKIKKAQKQTRKNMASIMGSQFGTGIQGMYSANMKDGGEVSDYQWVSHTWQPQVITHFGEHRVSDLLRPPHDADMLRTGGSIRQNYISPEEEMLTNMALGGQIETTWGGHAEPISYNPHMPATGQTIEFYGHTHDQKDKKGRTGIGVKYGDHDSYTNYAEYGTQADADVEVERGEPAVELPGADGENNMVVYGNLKIPNQFLHEIGDPKAKGKKFKTYVKDLAKKEQRQNKIIDSSSEKLDELNPTSPFDLLKFNSLAANIQGANMKLKQYAEFKTNAAAVQNAINDTAEQLGLDADSLAKGKVAMAKRGANVSKAQDGKKLSKLEALPTVPKGQKKKGNFWGNVTQEEFEAMKARNPWYDWENFNPGRVGDTKKFQKEFNKRAKEIGSSAHLREDDAFGEQTASAKGLYDGDVPSGRMQRIDLGRAYQGFPELKPVVPKTTGPATNILKPVTPPAKKDNSALINNLLGQAMQYLRPSDVEELDPNQLMGELYALSQNQVEPVWAQKATPRLTTPYDISLQDILNENRATLRRQQQMIGYNPAAQSALAAGEYEANQKVLAEQFRMNQAERNRVYEQNRNILNQYDMANLGLLGQQADKQAQALSKTKATTQEALSSISSKIAQNKLENRTLATYENLYNYRFDPRFRAQSFQTAQFNIPTVGSSGRTTGGLAPGYEFTYDASGNIVGTRRSSKDDTGRNGAILKALKNL